MGIKEIFFDNFAVFILHPTKLKIPSEMEVPLRCKLLTLLTGRTLSTWFTLLTCGHGGLTGLRAGADGAEGADEIDVATICIVIFKI